MKRIVEIFLLGMAIGFPVKLAFPASEELGKQTSTTPVVTGAPHPHVAPPPPGYMAVITVESSPASATETVSISIQEASLPSNVPAPSPAPVTCVVRIESPPVNPPAVSRETAPPPAIEKSTPPQAPLPSIDVTVNTASLTPVTIAIPCGSIETATQTCPLPPQPLPVAETKAPVPSEPRKMRVRLTFYSGLDDQYGSRVAWRKVREAKRGRTAAADPSVLPFGTWIHIPGLGKLRIEDTGSAVKAKTASRGTVPVIDVYVGNDQDARRLSRTMPDYVEITLHDPGPQKL